MMVRTLCRGGAHITGLCQGPAYQLSFPTTCHQVRSLRIASSSFLSCGPLMQGDAQSGGADWHCSAQNQSFQIAARGPFSGSCSLANVHELQMGRLWGLADAEGGRRESGTLGSLGSGRVSDLMQSARGVWGDAASASGYASVAGDPQLKQAGTCLETPLQAASVPSLTNGVVAEESLTLKDGALPFQTEGYAPAEGASKTAEPQHSQQNHLDYLTRRILTGAINLRAVVSHTSPLAKTHDSKKALAEQRSKKRKEASLEPQDGQSSHLEAVTTVDEVAANLKALERGALSELRIVNEDVFKQHMSTLRDSEQKQRIGTYRTLAGRILSETSTPGSPSKKTSTPSFPFYEAPTPSLSSEKTSTPSLPSKTPTPSYSSEETSAPSSPSENISTPSSPSETPGSVQGRSKSLPNKGRSLQCPDCWIPLENCMCKQVRELSRPLWPGMRVWMLMHAKEYRRKNNTGKVMWQLFGEGSVRPSISGLDVLEDDMWQEFAAAGPGRVFLMYPERKAQESMEIFYVDTLPLPSSPLPRTPVNESSQSAGETSNPSSTNAAAAAPAPNPPENSPPLNPTNPSGGPSSPPEALGKPAHPETPQERNDAAAGSPEPIHFVFLDGTWNNSTAMLVRLQQQAESVWGRKMACLCLTPDEVSKMHSLRPQPALEKVCTAAAASELLRELGARPELSDKGLSDAADTVDHALEILVTCLQGWRARLGRSPTRGPSPTPAENWVPREPGSRSRSPVRVGGSVE